MAIYNALTREIYGSGKDKLGGRKDVWYVLPELPLFGSRRGLRGSVCVKE